MNGLREIRESIEKFIYEKEQMQKQITEIEEIRSELAQKRNEKKKFDCNNPEINVLGMQISELGNQSQRLQNKLDFKFHEMKKQINLIIDNLISEGIRRIRKINEEIQEVRKKVSDQEQKNEKYELQKQEFYVRFGRMPELSENAKQEIKRREEEFKTSISKIEKLESQIKDVQEEIAELAKIKRELKNGNWYFVIETESENNVEELFIEPLKVEEMEPIEEISIEEFEPIEELYIEEFKPIGELNIEEFEPIEEFEAELKETVNTIVANNEENPVDELEELARAIIEEIVSEQTKDYNINKIQEQEILEDEVEDIIKYEEQSDKKDRVIIPLFGEKAKISNITVKIEDGELIYKAQMSDEQEVIIYPSRFGEQSVILRDKQNREECREILVNYAVSEYKVFDKKVINKIDPLICELLIECAERYNHEAQELVYYYAMSFSNKEGTEMDLVPDIIYNLSYIGESNLNKKEKAIINKICKNARKNIKIDIIESFSGFNKIKYIFKRLFAINNVKVLPEVKY